MAKQAKKKSIKKTARSVSPARIVDEAIRIGARDGWDHVRLGGIAGALKIGVADILAHFRDTNDIANAFFARALDAMTSAPNRRFAAMAPRDRIEALILTWFDYLAPHRVLVAQMLQAKMWPFHPHHWVPMVFDLSRLIQTVRDVAGLEAAGRRKQIEEIGLTGLFLATLAVWTRDETPDQERTRRFLSARLDRADQALARLFPRA